MRVALFTNGIWPYVIGGMQKHSYYLVKYFAMRGIEVDLYHMNKSELDIDKLDIFTESEKTYIRSFVFEFPRHGRWPWRYLSESYNYSKTLFHHFIRQDRPVDFIYTKSYTAWYALKEKRNGYSLPPIAIRLHGYEIFQPSKGLLGWYRKRLYMPLVHYLNKNADYIYSYGKGISDLIKNNIRQVEDKIIEVPTGIEPDWLVLEPGPVNTPLRFTFVGRYDIRKGVDELNKALSQLINEGQVQFEFNFIGPIPAKKQVRNKMIRYWGLVKDKVKLQEVLRNTDVFVLPSHSEGMPNVVLEAMASGAAVIATQVGAVNVMVDERNGWLIPPLDAKTLYKAMSSVLSSSPGEIAKRRIQSVERVKNEFLWEKIIDQEINQIKLRLKNLPK